MCAEYFTFKNRHKNTHSAISLQIQNQHSGLPFLAATTHISRRRGFDLVAPLLIIQQRK